MPSFTAGTVTVEYLANGLQAILQDTRQLTAEIDRIKKQQPVKLNLGAIGAAGNLASGALNAVNRAAVAVQRSIFTVGNELTRVGQVAATAAYRMQLIVAPIQAATGAIVYMGARTEEATRRIATQLDISAEAADRWAKETNAAVSRVAADTGANVEELANAYRYLVSSMDLTEEAAKKMLVPLAKFSVSGKVNAEEVAIVVAGAFNTFGKELERFGSMENQVLHITDAFNMAVRKGRAEMSDFSTGFGRAGQAGKIAGATFEEVLAILAGLSRVFTAAQATTTTENFFRALTKQSKEGAEAIQALNIALYEQNTVTGEMRRRSASAVMLEIFEKLAKLPLDVANEYLNAIFGTIRSFRGAITLQDVDMLNDVKNWAVEFANLPLGGETQREFEIMSRGLLGMVNRLIQTIRMVGQNFFDKQISDPLKRVVDAVREFFEIMLSKSDAVKGKMISIMTVISALPFTLLAFSTIMMTVGSAFTTLSILASPIGLATAVGMWLLFHDTLENLGGLIKDYIKADGPLGGLVKLIADLAVEFGILKQTEADKILESLGVSTQKVESDKFDKFVASIRKLGEDLEKAGDKIAEFFTGFTTFLKETETGANNTGKILNFLKEIVRISGDVVKAFRDIGEAMGLIKANTDEESTNQIADYIDKIVAGILVLKLAQWGFQGAKGGVSIAKWLAGLLGLTGGRTAAATVAGEAVAGGGIAASSPILQGLLRFLPYVGIGILAYLTYKALEKWRQSSGGEIPDPWENLGKWGERFGITIPPTPQPDQDKTYGKSPEKMIPPSSVDLTKTLGKVFLSWQDPATGRIYYAPWRAGPFTLSEPTTGVVYPYTGGGATGAGGPITGPQSGMRWYPITGTWENLLTPPPMAPLMGAYQGGMRWNPITGIWENILTSPPPPPMGVRTARTTESTGEWVPVVRGTSGVLSKIDVKIAVDAIMSAIVGAMGEWGQAFAAEHGGVTPAEQYRRHARPLQAALIDKMWGEEFARTHGRPPTLAEWQQHWYEFWMPLEAGQGGPIGEPTGPEAERADELLKTIINELLPDYKGKVEDIDKAWKTLHEANRKEIETELQAFKDFVDYINSSKPVLEITLKYKRQQEGNNDGNEDNDDGRVYDGKRQFGGYVWAKRLYQMAESGREFVLSNYTTRALEQRLGQLTQSNLLSLAAGANGTTISIGVVQLPSVTNAETFVRELKAIAQQPADIAKSADIKRRLRYS